LSQRSNGTASTVKQMFSGPWLNVANMFTALRVLLVVPVIILLVYNQIRLPYNIPVHILTGVIFILAALTDKADGYYARKHDVVTRLGQFLDPLADKLLMIPVMITLAYLGDLAVWVVVVVVAREVLISGVRVYGARKGIDFPASWSGKIKMFSQIIVVSVLIFFPGSTHTTPVLVLVYLMTAITVYSGIDYLLRARREIFGVRDTAEAAADEDL